MFFGLNVMEFHEVAEVFPLMAIDEYEQLKKDISKNGLLEPVIIYESKILDGRNRYKACLELGIEPAFEEFQKNDLSPTEYVISKNLNRRHLNASQRAVVALEFLPMLEAEGKEKQRLGAEHARQTRWQEDKSFQVVENLPQANKPDEDKRDQYIQEKRIEVKSRDRAGKLLEVNGRYVQDAKKITQTNPKLTKLIKERKLDLQGAKEIIKLSDDAVETAISFLEEESDEQEVKKIIRQLKKEERFDELGKISQGNVELKLEKKYNIIYCDPPWQYRNNSVVGAVENHYPTLSEDELIELGEQVKEIATLDSIIFMWATAPQLDVACRVMQAWGFSYTTSAVWIKNEESASFRGYYFKMFHELLLIGKRGNFPSPQTENISTSVIRIPNETLALRNGKRVHSKKPEEFYKLIEDMYPNPNLTKIELFARSKREGWDCWGNQVN